MFFVTAVVTLAGSVFFQPKLGIGANLWINEFVYILLPPLAIAGAKKWPVEDVYRLKVTSIKNRIISFLSGLCMWFFAFYLSTVARMLLDGKIGVLSASSQAEPSVYQSILLLIGMIVLAPICEEIFFRGFVQKAYEGYSGKYGFVITGIIFGAYHVLNGISEVLPATILGLGMGYLVYKTGSLSASMLFHSAANMCAVFIGGAIDIHTVSGIPVWLHIVAVAGLSISIILLTRTEGVAESTAIIDEENKADERKRISGTGVLFLILSALYLLAVAVLEILARMKII